MHMRVPAHPVGVVVVVVVLAPSCVRKCSQTHGIWAHMMHMHAYACICCIFMYLSGPGPTTLPLGGGGDRGPLAPGTYIWYHIWHHKPEHPPLWNPQQWGAAEGVPPLWWRRPQAASTVVGAEVYGAIYGSMYPTRHGTIRGIKYCLSVYYRSGTIIMIFTV